MFHAVLENIFQRDFPFAQWQTVSLFTFGIAEMYQVQISAKRIDPGSYLFPGGYLVTSLMTEEEEEHHLYGYYPLENDRNAFLACCFSGFYEFESIQEGVRQLILRYMKTFAGIIRIKNALRIALMAFPVVALVSLMVGWIYIYTIGQMIGAAIFSGALFIIGEAVAARNGYGP